MHKVGSDFSNENEEVSRYSSFSRISHFIPFVWKMDKLGETSVLLQSGATVAANNVTLLGSPYYFIWETLARKEINVTSLADTDNDNDAAAAWRTTLLLSTVAVLFLLGYGGRKSGRNENRKNRQVPVARWKFPVSIPLIESIYNIYNARKYGIKYLDMLVKEYGHFMSLRVGFGKCYVVSDPNIFQKIVTSTNPNHLGKTKFFYDRIFVGALNDALVASDPGIWGPHRKILSRAFTYKSLQSYLAIMNKYAKEMGVKMVEAAGDSGRVEGKPVYDIQYLYTIKIIGSIVMGADILTNEENRLFHENFTNYKRVTMDRLVHPLLMIDLIWWLHPKSTELRDNMDYLTRCITKVIASYKARRELERSQGVEWAEENEEEGEDEAVGLKPFRCMLEEMLHCGMSDKEIIDEVLMMMIAGHETSTLAITLLMFHLARHPNYQKMCREEVDNLLASKVASEEEYELTMDDLTSLKFIERCTLENLRLTPAIPLFIRRMDETLEIGNDLEVEKGTNVFLIPWSLHRNTDHFPDPEKFDPDRFLPENVKERHPYAFMPFSGGQRNCIGWKMALMEIKMVMFWILRDFEIYTTDRIEDINFRFEVTLSADRDIHLMLKRREKTNASS